MVELNTNNRKYEEMLRLAENVAASKASVLMSGEAGTGTDSLAQKIHELSPRANRPFVIAHCANPDQEYLEYELFGAKEGAGAYTQMSKVQQANGGTLFLEDVSELSLKSQSRLLQVLETPNCDIRIMASTQRDLSEMVQGKNFLENLFYKINVVKVEIPSLRERPEDIEKLSFELARQFGVIHGKPVQGLTPNAIQKIRAHSWPGNIRELECAIERAVLTTTTDFIEACNIEIETSTVISHASNSMSSSVAMPQAQLDAIQRGVWSPGTTLQDIEKNVILQALAFHSGNRTHTAKALGISIRTLRNKIAEFRLSGIYV